MSNGSNLSLGRVMGVKSQPRGLDENDAKLLGTIFSGAVSAGDKTKAGGGYMGLSKPGGTGEFRSVKFLTHWYERGAKTDSQLMKAIHGYALSGDAAFAASEQLERSLRMMAEKVGAGKTVNNLINGYKKTANYNGRSLLSRKIVFQVATAINEKSSRQHGSVVVVDNVAAQSSKHVSTSVKTMKVDDETQYSDSYEEILQKGFKPGKKFLSELDAELSGKRTGKNADEVRSCVEKILWGVNRLLEGVSKKSLTVKKLKGFLSASIKEACESGNDLKDLICGKLEVFLQKNYPGKDVCLPGLTISSVSKLLKLLEPAMVRGANAQLAEKSRVGSGRNN